MSHVPLNTVVPPSRRPFPRFASTGMKQQLLTDNDNGDGMPGTTNQNNGNNMCQRLETIIGSFTYESRSNDDCWQTTVTAATTITTVHNDRNREDRSRRHRQHTNRRTRPPAHQHAAQLTFQDHEGRIVVRPSPRHPKLYPRVRLLAAQEVGPPVLPTATRAREDLPSVRTSLFLRQEERVGAAVRRRRHLGRFRVAGLRVARD